MSAMARLASRVSLSVDGDLLEVSGEDEVVALTGQFQLPVTTYPANRLRMIVSAICSRPGEARLGLVARPRSPS
jgi:hypothetical protein